MTNASILVIDDDQDLSMLLSRLLSKQGYTVSTASRGAVAKEQMAGKKFDLVLCDHRLPDTDAPQMLEHIRATSPGTQVIIITGYSEVRLAVELMRKGAFDYIGKPLYPDELLMRVQDALAADGHEGSGPVNGNGAATKTKAPKPGSAKTSDYVEGTGPAAQLIAKHIGLVAPTDMSVLITGETGTGKEFVAKRIHQESTRGAAPFVAVDCGALPKELAGSELFGHTKGAFTGAVTDKAGSFEQAQGGTLFLDEVGNLTYENQIKLLRVLQERKIKRIGGTKDIDVDVRILAATNEDLDRAVAEGRFREDLLHRIQEFTIHLLPLRERKEDIPRFAKHFVELANARLGRQVTGFDDAAMQHMLNYGWSGNLRELGNVVKRAVLLSSDAHITSDCLPAVVLSGAQPVRHGNPTSTADSGTAPVATMGDDLRSAALAAEKDMILKVLERNGYNKSRTAEQLHIDRKTLYNKLKAFGLEV
ncbi:MAG: sigma-54-dependent Fis family transcriptional regulator [Flavobacteriales bacterium]|nr:MAG: sigma-54-dependent Fis family transcriptional regulator [Flavobacteriales bacterium]